MLDRVESAPSRDEARRLLELFFENRRFVLERGIDDMYAARNAPGADDAVKAIAASAFTRYGQNLVLTDRLGELEVPVLIVWGELDRVIPSTHAVAAADRPAHCLARDHGGRGPRAAGGSSAGIRRDRQSLAGVDPAPVTERTLVGIIANPASGKDIRRLVAHGSTFDNNEKINIVRRVLLGLAAAGVSEVAYLPDTYGIVERAAATAAPRLTLTPLSMAVVGHASDSTEAAQRLRDLGAAAIVTLGGDGTNRVVAKGCGDVPLLPLSTGTNNVFPRMVEGTLAGLAAGLVATGVARNRPGLPRVIRRAPRLEVQIDGMAADSALIDVVSSSQSWIGARALWEPSHLREIVLSRISASAIGIASLGGALFPRSCDSCAGAWIAVGDARDVPENRDDPNCARSSPRRSHSRRGASRTRRRGHASRRAVYARVGRRAGDRDPKPERSDFGPPRSTRPAGYRRRRRARCGRRRRSIRHRTRSSGESSGGLRSVQGIADSNAAAARRTVLSSRQRPTICKPTGSPFRSKPQGTVAAGWPVRLNGNVNGVQSSGARVERCQPSGSSSPAVNAVTGNVGVNSRSKRCKSMNWRIPV